MKRLSFFLPLMAMMAAFGLYSCTGTVESSAEYSLDTTAVEDTTLVDSIVIEPDAVIPENLEDFVVTSQGGYGAYVKERPSTDSERLTVYRDGTTFSGAYTDIPHWIMIVKDNHIVGYIHDDNVSPEEDDYGYDDEDGEYDNDSYSGNLSDSWTGASSVEELRQKIEGTYWYGKNDLFIYQLHFYNGKISMKVAQGGHWGDEYIYTGYNVIRHSTNNGDYLELRFEVDENEKLEHRGFSISFVKKCMIVTLHQFGDPECLLHYGKYEINYDL